MRLQKIIIFSLSIAVAISSCKKAEDETDEIIAEYTVGYFQQDDCSLVDSLNSSLQVPTTAIVFVNNSDKSLKIDWIDFTGNLVTYKESLEPGSSHHQGTFLTHPWYITTDNGNICVTILTGLRAGETDTVTFVNM